MVAPTEAPLFSDIARRPPPARPETIAAIKADPPMAEWVIYMGRQCEKHNCPQ
ncbi:hypothetical protein [Vannielia litorea]|uniref:hypothetical protein n=1 Tax=Vannielia litorea TaxID=1217970 RepID=UPI001BD1485D|nr:hypothetical protein [Vannielia litorea]